MAFPNYYWRVEPKNYGNRFDGPIKADTRYMCQELYWMKSDEPRPIH